jgi:hypothetical protein
MCNVSELDFFDIPTICPRIEFTRGKHFLFLILRKNFREIIFALFETPISVSKKFSSTQRKEDLILK